MNPLPRRFRLALQDIVLCHSAGLPRGIPRRLRIAGRFRRLSGCLVRIFNTPRLTFTVQSRGVFYVKAQKFPVYKTKAGRLPGRD